MNDLYEENLKRWSIFEPEISKSLQNAEISSGATSRSEEEVRSWFQAISIDKDKKVLYVFGVGKGETYPIIKEWLEKDPHTYLVYLEPKLPPIKTLLSTELGSKILHDKQVMLRPMNDLTGLQLATWFVLKPYLFANWDVEDEERVNTFKARLDFLTSQRMGVVHEYSAHGGLFFQNYFNNLLELPDAYWAAKLFGKFKGIPAIICGAGPSLAKNIEVLKTLHDRALIFAGATAMNALNAYSFNPHFGVGIDPNPEQYTRLIMNQAFEVPYLYKQRFLNQALKTVHGDHIALMDTSGYDIGKWVDEKLGLGAKPVEEGHNVVNLSTALAVAMGCNPIIFVGLDLAYTNMQSYSAGVTNHPLHNLRDQFKTKTHEEQLVQKPDIYGKPTLTLWKWIAESMWYTKFALNNVETAFINCTEGGIGFQGIPNAPLAVLAGSFKEVYDIDGRVNQAIQMAEMPEEIKPSKILALYDELIESILESNKLCHKILNNFNSVKQKIEADGEAPPGLLEEEGMEALLKLEEQPAYEAIYKMYNRVFQEIFQLEFEKLLWHADLVSEKESNLAKIALYRNRYRYMIEGGKTLLRILEESRKKGSERLQKIELPLGKNQLNESLPDDLENYSVFYGEDGQVISFVKYDKNKHKTGLAKTFYNSGTPHSLLNYTQDKLDGEQLYYYPDGTLKSLLNYKQGVLDGEVILYFSNGAIQRHLRFVSGKRQGVEQIWNTKGVLVVEAEFNQDKPHGIARRWHDNGQLAQEVIFKEDGTPPESTEWNDKGEKKIRTSSYRHDYFDQVALRTGLLTKTMEHMLSQVNAVIPAVEGAGKGNTVDLSQELETVKNEIQKMHEASQKLLFETGLDPSNPEEAIWKTPETRKEIEGQIDQLTEMMTGEIGAIQTSLLKTVELLSKKLATPPKES